MPLSKAQVEGFCGELAELFSVKPPRISQRRRIRCRWGQATLHLRRRIERSELAHQLAHYFDREFRWPNDPNAANVTAANAARWQGKRGRLHGRAFQKWQFLIGNYIAQEFGPGEGVTL